MNLAGIFEDVKCFAGLEGARDVQLSEDGQSIAYYKKELYNVDTPCTVAVKARKRKRGGTTYTLTTSWEDVSGEKRKLSSAPVYIESQLCHEAARHSRAIIA